MRTKEGKMNFDWKIFGIFYESHGISKQPIKYWVGQRKLGHESKEGQEGRESVGFLGMRFF